MWPRFNSFDESGVRTAFGEPEEHVTDRGIKFLHWLMTRYSCMRYSSATHQLLLPEFCPRSSCLSMSMLVCETQLSATISLFRHHPMSLYSRGHTQRSAHQLVTQKLKLMLCFCRPESRIAVVSHCGWLFHTLSAFSHAEAPVRSPPINRAPPGAHTRSSELDVDFQNCEMRTMVLTDPRSGPDRGDPTWFQGGHSFQSPDLQKE